MEIPFNEIELNDILIVNTGDKIPMAGIIIDGSCLIDESMITGESIPTSKQVKDEAEQLLQMGLSTIKH